MIGSRFRAAIVGAVTILFSLSAALAADVAISVTQTSYDADDRPTCVAVRMNPSVYGNLPSDACALSTAGIYGPDRITKSVYDAAGQVTETWRAVGINPANGFAGTNSLEQVYAKFAYTYNGLKSEETDANGNKTTYSYDGFDRLAVLMFPSKTTMGVANPNDYEAYNYDANGNRNWYRRRNGQVITYEYDALNRTTKEDLPDYAGNVGGAVRDVYTGYDLMGRVLWKRFQSASGAGVGYTYDVLGRVVTFTDMNGRQYGYSYNQASKRTKLTLPDGNYIGYGLDTLNRVRFIGLNANGGMIDQGYDDLGRRFWVNRATLGTGYAYDNPGRLTSLANDLVGTNRDITWSFIARDAANQVLTGYNPANQIVAWEANNPVYDYTVVTSKPSGCSFNGLNQDSCIAATDNNTGYDANGNLQKDGARVLAYDVNNRLISVTGNGHNITLNYDPEGRLHRYADGAAVTIFSYDGVNLIGEYSATNCADATGYTDDGCVFGTLRQYVHGTGTDEPLVWFEGAGYGDKRYFVQNYQGSVIGYTDSSGTLQQLYTYGPWGEPRSDASGTGYSWTGSRFRYTGQTMLGDAGLYYYKARVYDPIMGRFLQTDPIGSKDDLDLYAYVGGDPVNNSDPSGLCFDNCPNYYGPVNGQTGTPPSARGIAEGAIKEVLNTATFVSQAMNGSLFTPYGAAQRAQVDSLFGSPANANDATGRAVGAGAVIAGSMFIGAGEGTTTASLASRAGEVHGVLGPIAQSMRTTAVVNTAEGGRFVASSEKLLSPAQRAALKPGEVAARGTGHAEMTAVRAAEAAGQTPVSVGASRPVCSACQAELTKRGIKY